MSQSLPPEYFDRIYARNPDPWDFESSPYETEKYNRTMAILPRESYQNAFEFGCSIGVLTQRLAARCRSLLSVDVSETALAQARCRCEGLTNVAFQLAAVPEYYPEGSFDLTVVSEVGYYLDLPDLARLATLIRGHTARSGQLLLVHWLPRVEDYPLTGDQVHEYFLARSEWWRVAHYTAPQYRIDLLELLHPDAAPS